MLLKTWFLSAIFMDMLIFQRCSYFKSISIGRSFNDFNYSLLLCIISRSSQSHMVYKIGILKNFIKSRGKHLCWSVFFFQRTAGLRKVTLSKERPWHRCFPVNINIQYYEIFLGTPFLQKNLREARPDLSTLENWLLWDFENTIQNNIILRGAFENSLTSKLLLFTKIWPNNSSIATKLQIERVRYLRSLIWIPWMHWRRSGSWWVGKLMRFEIGKQTGNTFDNVYLLLCHKYHYKL